MIILGLCSEKVRIELAGLGSTEKAGACLGHAAVWTAQTVGMKVPQQPGFAQVLVEQVYHREVDVRKLRHRTFSEHEPYPPSLLFVILNETAENSISLTDIAHRREDRGAGFASGAAIVRRAASIASLESLLSDTP